MNIPVILGHPRPDSFNHAILKGWVDRVLTAGVAYRFQEDDSGEASP